MVVSPGPGVPQDAGVSVEIVRRAAEGGAPVLGVCLGHQAIGVAFGGRIVRRARSCTARSPRSPTTASGVFAGLPEPFEATRYHSLVIERRACPDVLSRSPPTPTTARSWACATRELPVEGVQFHPESILTGVGKQLLRNFLDRCARAAP